MANTVNDVMKKIRSRVIGTVSSKFLTDDYLIELLNDALKEFLGETKAYQSFLYTTTVEDQGYYTLPEDLISVSMIRLNGGEMEILDAASYFQYKGEEES